MGTWGRECINISTELRLQITPGSGNVRKYILITYIQIISSDCNFTHIKVITRYYSITFMVLKTEGQHFQNFISLMKVAVLDLEK